MPSTYEMISETPATETSPKYADEECWNCGELVSYGVVYYTCTCGVQWRPVAASTISKEIASSYFEQRTNQLIKANEGMPMVDHTKPCTAHP